MAPIRTAIIGLSPLAATSWAANAHLPYLLSPEGRENYDTVVLPNSSVASAQRAIETFGLDATTRAYGDPEALAANPDVELVVCNILCSLIPLSARITPFVTDLLSLGNTKSG